MTFDDRPPNARYRDFAAVAVLSTPDLERLLRAGDGPERVWAAWALGLRDAAGALPQLTAAAQSPDPGVRASLAVVLAGHGRRDALAALATADPDADVRAAACRHLAGTSLPDTGWVRLLLEHRLEIEDAPPVLAVLLDVAIAGHIAVRPERRARLLDHPDRRVRHPAAEHAISTWRPGDPMPSAYDLLMGEEEVPLRARAADMLVDRLGLGELTRLLAMSYPNGALVSWHLERLAEGGLRASWRDLEAVASITEAERGVLAILDEDAVAARPWLLRLVAKDFGYHPTALTRAVRLLRMPPPLNPGERASAHRVRAIVAEEVAEELGESTTVEDLPDDVRGWLEEQRVALATLDDAIRRSELLD